MGGGVSYSSNVDLFRSPAASWRDTIQLGFGPMRPDTERIPPVCRSEILEWEAHTTAVARAVMALLSEGLGLGEATLEEASCLEGKVMVCHYYPVCPEPDRTMGLVPHTDPGVLTVLAQDGVGGLQVKHTNEDGESYWVDAKPVPGALVINVGDLLQVKCTLAVPKCLHTRIFTSKCSLYQLDLSYTFELSKAYVLLPILLKTDELGTRCTPSNAF
jgi:isopenicillin N synthase-like dioxygenase